MRRAKEGIGKKKKLCFKDQKRLEDDKKRLQDQLDKLKVDFEMSKVDNSKITPVRPAPIHKFVR